MTTGELVKTFAVTVLMGPIGTTRVDGETYVVWVVEKPGAFPLPLITSTRLTEDAVENISVLPRP